MKYFWHVMSIVLLFLALYISTQVELVVVLSDMMRTDTFGGAFFVVALVFAVVLAPLAALPLIPIATSLFGPLLASLYSITGWTLGAIVAFAVARFAGRPLVERVVSLETLARYEHLLPTEMIFISLVLLRMVIPVDVLSYAVGVLSTVRFSTYALATLIGVTPFSFIFAYGSDALVTERYLVLLALVALSLLIFTAAFYLYLRHRI